MILETILYSLKKAAPEQYWALYCEIIANHMCFAKTYRWAFSLEQLVTTAMNEDDRPTKRVKRSSNTDPDTNLLVLQECDELVKKVLLEWDSEGEDREEEDCPVEGASDEELGVQGAAEGAGGAESCESDDEAQLEDSNIQEYFEGFDRDDIANPRHARIFMRR